MTSTVPCMTVSNHTLSAHSCFSRLNIVLFYLDTFSVPKARLFMAFSVYTNGRNLLSAKKFKSTDMMDCVHGIRVLSTQWVVLGHTYNIYMFVPTMNTLEFVPNVSLRFEQIFSRISPILEQFSHELLRIAPIAVHTTISQHVPDVRIYIG